MKSGIKIRMTHTSFGIDRICYIDVSVEKMDLHNKNFIKKCWKMSIVANSSKEHIGTVIRLKHKLNKTFSLPVGGGYDRRDFNWCTTPFFIWSLDGDKWGMFETCDWVEHAIYSCLSLSVPGPLCSFHPLSPR